MPRSERVGASILKIDFSFEGVTGRSGEESGGGGGHNAKRRKVTGTTPNEKGVDLSSVAMTVGDIVKSLKLLPTRIKKELDGPAGSGLYLPVVLKEEPSPV